MAKWIVDIKGEIEGDYDLICKYEERPNGEWIRKEDIIHLLESWADGYSYIEIPTETAIKEVKELGDEQND